MFMRQMDFIDDEADSSDGEEILVPSSQSIQARRPTKRRRLNKGNKSLSTDASESNPHEYDLPSNTENPCGDSDEDALDQNRSKYRNLTHVPQFAETPRDTYVTQLSQPWSSPTRIRGPRWRKQANSPSLQGQAYQPKATANDLNTAAYPHAGAIEVVHRNIVSQPEVDEFDDEDDDDDSALLEAFLVSKGEQHGDADLGNPFKSISVEASALSRHVRNLPASFKQTTLNGVISTQVEALSAQNQSHNWPLANRNEDPTHHKLNNEALKTWVYPINLGRIRDYQYTIVHKGLFHNLLVALPTGLGKTFIAATVMLNWFRWTLDAQMIFVAPTKPLVAQQIDACFNIVGIPRSQTTMLTGEVQPAIRAEEWQEKRVFFMTPQTLVNDLKSGMCDPKRIVLLVVDEAHKATGNYAYVEVVRFLRRFNSSFRVLALTATPGATVEAVQKVVDGLDIARVEIRTEDSIDIRDFVHSRNTELEVFENTDDMSMCLELFASAVRPLMNKLNTQNAYWGKDPTMISLFGLKTARDQWNKSDAGKGSNWGIKGMVNSIFTVLMSLAHNVELLKYHGIGPFYHKMKIFEEEAYGGGKYAKQIVEDEHFKKLMNRLRVWVNNPDFIGHPKLSYLKTVVLNHFMDAGEGQGRAGGRPPSDTRIMIFAHYRDSAEEIARVLRRHEPMIRAHVFVGQSGTKNSEGMDQKAQLDIIAKFKAGTYNTIVATSIGEEGLDIGEVDLIVCYDCSKSPIRMLQRMGRTGRKRAGNIVVLLMRGKEENDYYRAKDNYLKMQDIIATGKHFDFHEDRSPRMVPKDVTPVVDKRIVEIPIENTQVASLEPRKRATKSSKRPPKKFHMPDGVETGFKFLGNSKNGQAQVKSPKPITQPAVDQVVATIPPLDSILLRNKEKIQLDERYMQVAGTQPQYIDLVRFDAYPDHQQHLGPISTVGHSFATKMLVGALSAMRQSRQEWTTPSKYDIMTNIKNDGLTDSDSESSLHIVSSKPGKTLSSKASRKHSYSPIKVVSDIDEYDTEDSFINNAPLRKHRNRSESNEDEMRTSEPISTPKPPEVEPPFYVSQISVRNDLSEDELPDLDVLVSIPKQISSVKQALKHVITVGRRGTRRVMDSDDDNDDGNE